MKGVVRRGDSTLNRSRGPDDLSWDLDTEARERAEELGMGFARAATAGPDPQFADMVAELVAEHTDDVAPRALGAVPSAGCTVNVAPCAVDCCVPARRPSPARSD